MSVEGEGVGAAAPPPPPAPKDPLDFNTFMVTARLVAWANDPKNSKTVKTRDGEKLNSSNACKYTRIRFRRKTDVATEEGCASILLYPI